MTALQRYGRLAGWLAALAAGVVAVLDTYLGVVTLIAARMRSGQGDPAHADQTRAPRQRYAVLVPAHNESASITATVDSVLEQGDHGRVSLHVVADNCSDDTADVVRSLGGDVHERFDTANPGKGPALGWLLQRVMAASDPTDPADRPDIIVIIDADTTVGAGFFEALDRAVSQGGAAWQSYYAVRDPELSPSTALRSIALALRHYVRPLGRTAVGASSGLFGNGMAFRPELLTERSFSAHLTEDVEFQLELLLDGHPVGFVPDAVVEAEMPTGADAAITQNERWEAGRLALARAFAPRLLAHSVRPTHLGRRAYLDALLDQAVPPLSVLTAATAGTAMISAAAHTASPSRGSRVAVGTAAFAVIGLTTHVVVGIRVARVPGAVVRHLIHAPRYVVWKTMLWLRMSLDGADVAWTRTARNPTAHDALDR